MKKYFLYGLILFLASCKINPDSNRNYADEAKIYKLHLSPASGSKYHYDLGNETEFKLEIDDKKIANQSKTDVGINYEINKDSAQKLSKRLGEQLNPTRILL